MRQATSLVVLVGLFTAATAAAQTVQPVFRTSVGDTVFGGAESLVVTDLDGDGLADLVMPGGQAGAVAVFYGLGDGLFDFQRDFVTGNVPVAAAVADFNDDDFLDIATVDSTTSIISVILGSGDRESFSDPVLTDPSTCSGSGAACENTEQCPEGQTCEDRGVSSPNGMIAQDLNGDQQPDLAIVSGESQGLVAVVFGVGNGTFIGSSSSPYDSGATSRAIESGDVNEDGRPDLLTANRDAGTISVLLNSTNTGVFLPASNYPAGEAPVDLTLGDFDEDGNLDVAVANRNTDRFSLLLGNGSGAFGEPTTFAAGSFPSTIASTDFDGDGNLDVAVGNKLSYDVTIGYGDGDGGFALLRSFLGGTGPEVVATAPMNADQAPDVVVLGKSGEGDSYTVLLSTPGRSFQAIQTVRSGANPGAVIAGDYDRNGLPDMVVSSGSGAPLTLMRSQGDGNFASSPLDLGGATFGLLLADLDRSGNADLLASVRLESGDQLAVARPDGHGGFQQPQLTPLADAAAGLDVADFNEDGLLDVAVTQGEREAIAVLIRKADGTFQAPLEIPLRPIGDPDPFFPRAVATADLDGDGNMDMAVAEYRDLGVLSLIYGRGDGTFETPPVGLAAGRRPLAVSISDVDNDGLLDLLTANEDTAGLVLLRATGPRSYATPVTMTAGRVPAALVLRDINNDGVRDVMVADRTDDRFVLRLGGRTTSPFFSSVVQTCPQVNCLESGRTPIGVVGADFDADGSYDMASVNDGGANVAVAMSELGSEVLRGDGNQDGRVSAADLTAVWGRVPQYNRQAIEDLVRSGAVPTLNLDGDGDGMLSSVDASSVAARIFR